MQIHTKQRSKCKKIAKNLSLEYRNQLAKAKEDAGETKAATYLRNLDSIESTRRLFRNIRYLEEKIKCVLL